MATTNLTVKNNDTIMVSGLPNTLYTRNNIAQPNRALAMESIVKFKGVRDMSTTDPAVAFTEAGIKGTAGAYSIIVLEDYTPPSFVDPTLGWSPSVVSSTLPYLISSFKKNGVEVEMGGVTTFESGDQATITLTPYTPPAATFALPALPTNGKISNIQFKVGEQTYGPGDNVTIPSGVTPVVSYQTVDEQVTVTIDYTGTTEPDVQPVS